MTIYAFPSYEVISDHLLNDKESPINHSSLKNLGLDIIIRDFVAGFFADRKLAPEGVGYVYSLAIIGLIRESEKGLSLDSFINVTFKMHIIARVQLVLMEHLIDCAQAIE